MLKAAPPSTHPQNRATQDARRYNETLLSAEPHNKQALSLSKLIDERVKTEGLVGMAIVGGVVGAVGLLTAGIIAATRR